MQQPLWSSALYQEIELGKCRAYCGYAILVQRGHQQVLVDGGPDAERICLELGDKLPFWDRTIELGVFVESCQALMAH
jgi:hypothetical protein